MLPIHQIGTFNDDNLSNNYPPNDENNIYEVATDSLRKGGLQLQAPSIPQNIPHHLYEVTNPQNRVGYEVNESSINKKDKDSPINRDLKKTNQSNIYADIILPQNNGCDENIYHVLEENIYYETEPSPRDTQVLDHKQESNIYCNRSGIQHVEQIYE